MSTSAKDYYVILGLNKNASIEEIKIAYKKLVKQYHPDKYLNHPLASLAEEKIKEINEAYEFLIKNHKSDKGTKNNYYRENRKYENMNDLEKKIDESFDKRTWLEVLEISDKMITLENNYVNAYIYKALALQNLNRYSEAIFNYTKAENLGWKIEQDADIYFSKAISQIDLGRYKDAIITIENLIRFAGEIPNYVAHLAYCYESINDMKEANLYWNRLKIIDPNNELLKQKEVYSKQKAEANTRDAAEGLCCFCVVLQCLFDFC